ncbi:GNAT family N-acetyltransferase [Roseobacter weihaiensis]|uniref:GNAT family N-acetyltransferase n=1 Tax=Roseobacter weihaiensis TaxID=2763262 RepID=UPI001D0B0007|nr:GNAT family N-acetyltransferase [Roseobacter sp. H9]
MTQIDTSILIRRGRREDAANLAKLHVDVWRATYASLAPVEAKTLLDEARRLPYWQSALVLQEPGKGVWVAVDADEAIRGVISFDASGHPAFEGRREIKHLYVALDAQGQGIGQRLLQMAISECRTAGACGVALAVVRQNALARQFYKKMGGVEIGGFTDPGPLWRSDNIVVAWDNG